MSHPLLRCHRATRHEWGAGWPRPAVDGCHSAQPERCPRVKPYMPTELKSAITRVARRRACLRPRSSGTPSEPQSATSGPVPTEACSRAARRSHARPMTTWPGSASGDHRHERPARLLRHRRAPGRVPVRRRRGRLPRRVTARRDGRARGPRRADGRRMGPAGDGRRRAQGRADASNVALAARYRTRTIVTLDRRHFDVLRPLGGGRFTVLP